MGKMHQYCSILIFLFFALGGTISVNANIIHQKANMQDIKQDSVLRHVVLFKFKSGTTPEQLADIETAFTKLPDKISEIIDFEWGLNNSPEGLDKGFTHCFFVSFKNEEGREIYLPHPDHKAFVSLASPHIEDVLVFDYWAPTG